MEHPDLQRINRIREFMTYYGYNVSAFASKIKVSRSTITKVMSGENRPGRKIYEGIAESHPDVDMNYLATGEGSLIKGKSQEEKKEFFSNSVFMSGIMKRLEEHEETLKEHTKRLMDIERHLQS